MQIFINGRPIDKSIYENFQNLMKTNETKEFLMDVSIQTLNFHFAPIIDDKFVDVNIELSKLNNQNEILGSDIDNNILPSFEDLT